MPDFDSFTRISYTIDFSAFCSVGLAGFVGGELSLSEEKGLRLVRPGVEVTVRAWFEKNSNGICNQKNYSTARLKTGIEL